MNTNTLLLLIAGSFLPNNICVWLFKYFKRLLSKNDPTSLKDIKAYYHKFETDPQTQYRYHKRMQKFWLLNFIPMLSLISLDIYYSLKHGVDMPALVTACLLALNTIYSLYANFDTETGDAHASYASMRADEIKSGEQNLLSDEQVQDLADQILSPHEANELAAEAI